MITAKWDQMLPFDEQQVVVLSVPLGLLGLSGMVVSGAVPEPDVAAASRSRRSCAEHEWVGVRVVPGHF